MNKVLCVIPARAKSKGLPNKNIKLLLGKPLVQHTIDLALKCEFFDKIVVTTDIDELVTSVINQNRANHKLYVVRRSVELAGDSVPLAPVLLDAIGKAESQFDTTYSHIVSLQPTSCLLSYYHIGEAYQRYVKTRADSLISVREELHSIWYINNGIVEPVSYQKVCRQEVHPYYVGNGAIFITKREILMGGDRLGGKIELYPMDWVSSFDIHTQEDFEIGEWLKSMRCG